MQPYWYLVHCEAHHDGQVARLVGLQGMETFAPRIQKSRRREGDKPLFPGYVFARLDLGNGQWQEIRYLPGVRSLVGIGGTPCMVDAEIVDKIRQRLAAGAFVRHLRPGDRIQVLTGAFADLEGIFCETLSGAERVAILIQMMRRQVRVEIPAEEIKVIGQVEPRADRPGEAA